MIDVGVIGTGTMGPQIAIALSASGYSVMLYNYRNVHEVTPRLERLARVFIRRSEGDISDPQLLLKRIRLISELNALASATVVIEAVTEDLFVKQGIFTELDRICKNATILASNTSSLRLEDIGQRMENMSSLIGLHFFNPVFETDLVEMITTPTTSEKCVPEALAFIHSLHKVPLLFSESCVNRLLIPMINEACHALEQGLGRVEDIDRAMKSGANHPMGPFALADLIGVDVVVAILQSLVQRHGRQYQPAKTLTEMLAQGRLGRKTNHGFYSYGKSKTPLS